MAADQFCLKWNNFQTSIINAFESLQITEDLVDVTLTCEGINVKAHKIILSACSPYFRAAFKENPCPHPIVILKNVLHSDLLAILNFMYHGEVLIKQDQLTSFLQTAELLQVSGLIGSSDLPFRIISGGSSPKSLFHASKTAKVIDTAENSKKTKTPQKSKSTKAYSRASCIFAENILQSVELPAKENLQLVTESNSTSIDSFEVVTVDDIKTEFDDQLEGSNITENTENDSEKAKQLSILETALDLREPQPSILERSLTGVTGKLSSTILPPLEHITSVQQASEEPLTLYIHGTHSDPEDGDKRNVKHKITDAFSQVTKPFDLNSESEPKISKLDDYATNTMEGNLDTIQGSLNDFTIQNTRLCADTQPHHSSQCGKCPHCGKIYSNQSALKYHVRLVHSDLTNMYCCHLCPESFDYREGYKKHMIDAHSIRN